MKVTYSWIVYSCFIFGTGILCDRKLERRQAESSCSEYTDDQFICSNGLCIESPLVCDGNKDCSDGSDESKELCAIYEFRTDMTMDCGKVNTIEKEVSLPPWGVDIYKLNKENKYYVTSGSIIAPNIVISGGYKFWKSGITSKQTSINDGRYKAFRMGMTWKEIEELKNFINVTMIYLTEDYNPSAGFNNVNIAVILLADKVSLSNGYAPICIDWFNKYNAQKEAQKMTIGAGFFHSGEKVNRFHKLITGSLPYMENSTCMTRFNNSAFSGIRTYDTLCIKLKKEQGIMEGVTGAGLAFLYSNTYFLTGIMTATWSTTDDTEFIILDFTDIKHYVPWIRGILNKHVIVNSCVLPTIEGVIYSYGGSQEIISHGTLIDNQIVVVENCEIGYHKTYPNSYRFCQGNGKWKTVSDKLCLKMCPPLLSDGFDIKCTINGKYANCSKLSIPDTKAIQSCEGSYTAPNGHKEEPLELLCQSNGLWNKQLNRCNPMNVCVLPTIEGVIYSHEDSQEIIPHGTLIDHRIIVIENCEVGYHKTYPTSYRVCQGSGKWVTISEKLCLKMCPPLLSDKFDIKCTVNGKYDNCSNLSIPGTIAIPSCKASYTAPNEQEEEPLELLCQSNGLWNKELNRCNPLNVCVLPTIEGVLYSYEGSREIISHGTLINHHITVFENCEVGYHKAYPNSFRVCQKYGKWKTVSDKLCLKMCPPLLSDSLYIKCTLNGKYANCSNLSIPDTIAKASCKPSYAVPYGQKEVSLELLCQTNGNWDKQLYKCNSLNVCLLPAAEGVIYTYEDSNERLPHGTLINHHITVFENCEVGYHKSYSNSFRICQTNGKWKTVSDKLCLKMCPPLLSDSLDIKCTRNGKYANCSNLSIPDTIAKPSCKPSYAAPNGQEEVSLDLRCQTNGNWNKQLYRCNPYCGRGYNMNNVLISNGIKAPVGTAPWHVGLYKFNTNTSNHDLLCGGSIISPNLVVSAAHCFGLPGISRNISINDDRYKIAVGKYNRNFTIKDNEFTKIINVKIVYLNEHYYGFSGFYFADIAIIVLQSNISFSNGVAPVCIDFNSIYNEHNGDTGKIVGWGRTENNIFSPILLEASLPYIDHDSCRKMYTNGFQGFVTSDKFCAGSESGQGANYGDSGSGLSFIHSNSYYLTGVVSVKDRETNNSISVFTELKFHIDWIHRLYNEYN